MSEAEVADGPPPLYAEPARSYRPVTITAGIFVVAFVIDMALEGPGVAVTHLPGWFAFGAIIVGAHLLFVYAARASHSLRVTEDELRIGDEWLPRAEIAALVDNRTDDLPVLGWPNTRPRQIGSIVVRLTGGEDIRVPTRHPQQLSGVLGLAHATDEHEAEPDRPRVPDENEIGMLADIDERADTVFRVAGYRLPPVPFDTDAAAAAAAVFVLGDPPVAFVQIDDVDGCAHITEIAVVPSAMRRGNGSMLLEHAAEWARDAGYPALTLTTFADVAWNGPYYAARGFRECPPDGPELAARRERERAVGLDRVGRRIAMRRDL